MNALQQLIRAQMTARRWSYADVAHRGGLPRSTVHHLATHEHLVRPPHPATLAALARGLEVPLNSVRVAAATAAGLAVWPEPNADPEVEVLVAALSKLTPQDRAHVRALVESLLHGYRADDDQPPHGVGRRERAHPPQKVPNDLRGD